MDEEKGKNIQEQALKLFSSFFNRQVLSLEMTKSSQFDEHSVASFIALIEKESVDLNISLSQHSTCFVIKSIDHLSNESEFKSNVFLLTVISVLHNRGLLCHREIQAKVNGCSSLIPLNLIVQLDKAGIISFIHYFQSCIDDPKKMAHWVRCLTYLASEPEDEDDHNLLIYLLEVIIEIGHGNLFPEVQRTVQSNTLKAAVVAINNVTRKIWNFLWQNPEKKVHLYDITLCDPQQHSGYFNLLSFQNCYLEQLAFLLSYKPEIKASAAISSQHEWIYSKIPPNVIEFISQILYPLEDKSVIDKIDEILCQCEINWKTLLVTVSIVHVSYPSGNKILRGLINCLLQRAVEKSLSDLLLAAFLLARQIYCENISTNYGLWFSSITGSSTSSKNFAFLMNFLTSIARYEPASILKSHLNNPPYVPMVDNCRGLWTDYTALIRTRLVDLGAQASSPTVEVDTATEKDVESAITAYGRGGRIPTSVTEAAIFRKPYFVHKFLPALLKPRCVPNPPDVREKLIMDLKTSGKMPHALYEGYVAACVQLSHDEATVGGMADVHHMDWQAPETPNDYQNLLVQITHCSDFYKRSLLQDKFASVLSNLMATSNTQPEMAEIRLERMNEDLLKDQISWKVFQAWLDNFQEILANETEGTDWINQYFFLLGQHVPLFALLFYKVWQFVRNCNCLGENEIRLYGALIFLLCKNDNALPAVNCMEFKGSFTELLVKEFHVVRAASIHFHLKLLWNVINESKLQRKSHLELECLQRFTQIYFWVARRVQHASKAKGLVKYLNHLNDPVLWATSKLELEKWLRLELNVQVEQDVLQWTERCRYLHSVFETDHQNNRTDPCATYAAILESVVCSAAEHCSGNCAQDLLVLLQSQILQQAPFTSATPWLIQLWMRLLDQEPKSESTDLLMWSIICALPSFLLCRNSYCQPVEDANVCAVSQLIEQNWRNSVTEGAWLPKYVTSHLLRALNHTSQVETIPCLQFSKQVHEDDSTLSPASSASWKALGKALDIFPLRHWNQLATGTGSIQWSGQPMVDQLTSQLVALAAGLWFSEKYSQDWPWFVRDLSSSICTNPTILKGWKMSSWFDDNGCLLPWSRMLPTSLANLLPCVVLHVLISWSPTLLYQKLPIAKEFLEALVSAHTKWIETTQTFVDLLGSRMPVEADYPAGELLDLAALGKLITQIQQVLHQCPLPVLKSFQYSQACRSMDAGFQSIVKSRIL